MSAELAQERPLDLREYLGVLRRRKASIAIVTVTTFVLVMAYSFRQTPMYTSTAKIWVKPIVASQSVGQGGSILLSLDTEKELVASESVADLAARRLPGETGFSMLQHLSVSVPSNSQLLVISYSSPDPIVAQKGAQAFALAYRTFKVRQAMSSATLATKSLQQQLTDLQNALAQARYDVAHTPNGSAERFDAESRATTIGTQIALLQTQISSLNSLAIDPGSIVQQANLPTSPSSPNHLLNAALGLFLGLALGIGVAFVRERLDDRLRSREDLEEHLGAPVLVAIPKFSPPRRARRANRPGLITVWDPGAPAAEAYRTLRTSLQFYATQTGAKTFMVVSATPGEGKTTTAANLAVVLAQAGKQTVLLSADLRNPALNQLFHSDRRVQKDAGISNILTGELNLQDTVHQTEVKNLWMIASGPLPGRPAELASSESMAELIGALHDAADYTIIDSAPALAVADTLAMASRVDAIIYVADDPATKRTAVVDARTMLERVGATVAGAVLNRFEPSKTSGYRYAYRYTYRYGAGAEAQAPQAAAQNGDGGRAPNEGGKGESLRRPLRRT